MNSRKIVLVILTCAGVAILGLMSRGPVGREDPAGDGYRLQSKTRRNPDDALTAERRADRQARETLRDDPVMKQIWIKDSSENILVSDLLNPFNPSDLRRMIDSGDTESWPLSDLIFRAAAEKHPDFQDLLERADLRADPRTDMALCAYDYSVNGKREALERILATHRAAGAGEEPSWMDPAVRALLYINEWDLSREALAAHPMVDGESAYDASRAFWLTRRFLFPRNQEFPEDYDSFVGDLQQK